MEVFWKNFCWSGLVALVVVGLYIGICGAMAIDPKAELRYQGSYDQVQSISGFQRCYDIDRSVHLFKWTPFPHVSIHHTQHTYCEPR